MTNFILSQNEKCKISKKSNAIIEKHFTTGMPIQERIDFRSEYVTETGCKIWTGACSIGGYGIIATNKKNSYVHRLVYELNYGEIQEGKFICHKCDTPSCINPDHLFLGDSKINMDDKVSKGRQSRGESAAAAILTTKQVLAIRNEVGTQIKIANKYGISQPVVSAIKRKANWKHV